VNARRAAVAAGIVAWLVTSPGALAMSVKDFWSAVPEGGRARVLRIVTNTEAYRHAAAGRPEVARCLARTVSTAALLSALEKEKDRGDRSVEAVVLRAMVAQCPTRKPPAVSGPADLTSDWTPVGIFQRQYSDAEKRYAISLVSAAQGVRLLVEGRKRPARCIAKRFMLRAGQADPKGLTKLVKSMDPDLSVDRNIVDALAATCRMPVEDATAPG
jgi:hypothetical protein